MKRANAARKLDRLGRLVLPLEARRALKWEKDMELDIVYDTSAREVILRAHEDSCVYCGSRENLILFKNYPICRSCREQISNLMKK